MAKMTHDTSTNIWKLQQSITSSGTVTKVLQTQNTFIDKNINIEITTPAAAGSSLSITDKASTEIQHGTASDGKYLLTQSLTGTMSFSTSGWIKTGDSAATATDSSVTVGYISQSDISGITLTSNAGSITPNVSNDQTITIGAGYYHTARTITVKGMTSGTAAAATVSVSKQATAPTLANTASAISGMTQITLAPSTTAPATSNGYTYYVAMTATAPATSLAASNFTKTIGTAGYLNNANQITIGTSSVTAKNQLFYAPLTSAALAVSATTAAINPTASKNSTATISSKTRLDPAVLTKTTSEITTDYFYAVNLATAATTISFTKGTLTEGYLGSSDQITTSSSSTAAGSSTYYISIAKGALANKSSSVSATGTNITITESSTQPTSGYWFKTTGSGTIKVSTAGWLAANTEKTSTAVTKYYTLPAATFTVVNNQVTTGSSGGGYVSNNTVVGTITSGSITSGETSKSGYSNLDIAVPSEGYLYIAPGYYNATQISLASLIPDNIEATDAAVAQILSGYEAFDTAGKRLVGTIPIYDGSYETPA